MKKTSKRQRRTTKNDFAVQIAKSPLALLLADAYLEGFQRAGHGDSPLTMADVGKYALTKAGGMTILHLAP